LGAATSAVAAAKSHSEVISLANLDEWLPGYTATIHAIVMEPSVYMSGTMGANFHFDAVVPSMELAGNHAVAQELLFQLKSTIHNTLDRMLQAEVNVLDNLELIKQVALANAQLIILQESLPDISTSKEALELLTSSTQAKIWALSADSEPVQKAVESVKRSMPGGTTIFSMLEQLKGAAKY